MVWSMSRMMAAGAGRMSRPPRSCPGARWRNSKRPGMTRSWRTPRSTRSGSMTWPRTPGARGTEGGRGPRSCEASVPTRSSTPCARTRLCRACSMPRPSARSTSRSTMAIRGSRFAVTSRPRPFATSWSTTATLSSPPTAVRSGSWMMSRPCEPRGVCRPRASRNSSIPPMRFECARTAIRTHPSRRTSRWGRTRPTARCWITGCPSCLRDRSCWRCGMSPGGR